MIGERGAYYGKKILLLKSRHNKGSTTKEGCGKTTTD